MYNTIVKYSRDERKTRRALIEPHTHLPPSRPRPPPQASPRSNLQCTNLPSQPPKHTYNLTFPACKQLSTLNRKGWGWNSFRRESKMVSVVCVIFSPGNCNARRDCDKKWTAGNVHTLGSETEWVPPPRRSDDAQCSLLYGYVFYTTLYFETVWKGRLCEISG